MQLYLAFKPDALTNQDPAIVAIEACLCDICYTDDTQLDALTNQEAAIVAMEACLHDIRQWMIRDKLVINDEKTELMMIGTRVQLAKVHLSTFIVGEAEIIPTEGNIRNI